MGAGCFEFARLQETVWFARVSDHLVDTSVWVEHLRSRSAALVGLLERGAVLMHPFVLGEAALGNLSQRGLVLEALANLPMATVANDREVLGYINAARLYGLGIGYVDAHLLASVRLTPEASLWTRDRRLEAAAETLGLRAPLVKAGRSVTAGAQPGNPHRRA
ncbi:type II toxin-antitoxin system VapC family toxin [Phenylobacterium sp.]|uniref:type II toxin-antitoxin system VapC family toxin n=1 Tax=Phenylobacterium sp. TaxID=1871053 RepID=UPI0039C9D730